MHIPSPETQLKKYPHQLSGGMLQRVLIAIALAGEPRLLVADEPTSALDVTVQAGVLDLLLELQERTRIAILMITHDLGVARVVSDRIHVMKDGRFVESGEVEQIVDHARTDYTRKLLAAVPQLGPWDGELDADQPRHRPPSMIEGSPAMSQPLLSVENLVVEYHVGRGVHRAVDDVSFSIDKGKTLAVVGESGCGKSTIAKALVRLLKPTSGNDQPGRYRHRPAVRAAAPTDPVTDPDGLPGPVRLARPAPHRPGDRR